MRYIWQHIKTIIDTYDGSLPLAHFLKNYFRQHPILGSRDRKMLSTMAYSFYRAARTIRMSDPSPSIGEQIIACMALCGHNDVLPPGSEDGVRISHPDFDGLFPFDMPLSAGITKDEWLRSMLVQPDMFIRVRKDKDKLISLLNGQKTPFKFISDNCLSLPNGAKIDALLPQDAYVVQDASSQQTGTYFQPGKNEEWYDCCSGAGGKSLLLKDMEPGVRLTVSDRRKTIIHNLQQRFRKYRHVLPVTYIADVADHSQLEKVLGPKKFDNIICDAPCSGSGTWARTPEQLYFFDPKTPNHYSALQNKIAINVAEHLKDGGRLFYITCSIFRQENEEVVAEIQQQTGLHLIQSQLINGISIHADSMYVAVFQKN